MGKNQHITKHSDGWQVKGTKNTKATKVFTNQKEAIEYGTKIAKNQQSELFIHDKNGRIRERNSYGNDPYPPKG